MNRSWRVAAAGGVVAVKEVLDVDAATARRQATCCGALAGRGLPVPEPLCTADGDHVVEHGGAVFTAARWVDGTCRPGAALSLAEAAQLVHGSPNCTSGSRPCCPRRRQRWSSR